MNDELANDRTFLAWLRSGIALFGLGFVVAKAALVLESGSSDKDLYATVGVLFVLSGAALMAVGYTQHRAVAKPQGCDQLSSPFSPWSSFLMVSGTSMRRSKRR